jgi:NADH dehydrogenase
VGESFIDLTRGDEEERFSTRTVVWTAGVESTDLVKASGLPMAGRSRVKTDAYLRSENYPDVFVAGDNLFFVPEGEERPVPQMVENCEHSADTVAHNIACAVGGKGGWKNSPRFHGRHGQRRRTLRRAFGTSGKKSSFLPFSPCFLNPDQSSLCADFGLEQDLFLIHHSFLPFETAEASWAAFFQPNSELPSGAPPGFLGAYWVYEGMKKIGENWLVSAGCPPFSKAPKRSFCRPSPEPAQRRRLRRHDPRRRGSARGRGRSSNP